MIKKLYKDPNASLVGGVLGGLSQYLNLDPVMVRAVYALLTVATSWLPGIIIYLLLWRFLPNKADVGFTDYDIE